jgi:WD40 repeat protein
VWNRADWREICSIVPRPDYDVSALAISPDGTLLVSSHGDRTVQVWDVDTGAELHQLRGHVGPVGLLAFSPDGRRIIGGNNQDLHIWEPLQGRMLLTFREESPFRFEGYSKSSVGASQNSAQFIAGSQSLVNRVGDGRLRIRAGHRMQAVMPLTSHIRTVNCVAYSPNGLVLATASEDCKVKLFDTTSGAELHTLSGHQGSTRGIAFDAVRDIAFNADGSFLASCGVDKTVRLWEVTSGREKRVLAGHTKFPQAVAFRPDGKRLLTGDDDAKIFVWDVATGEAVTTWKADKQVSCLAYSPDGRRVASSGSDFNITLWDDATGERVSKLTGHVSLVLEVAFSPDGRWIASSGADSKVLLWNAATGEPVPSPGGHQGYVYGLAFSADSRWLATGGMGKQVHIWDIATNRELVTFHGHPATIMGVAFHPNGRQLTSVGYGYRDGDAWGPGTIRVWNIPPIDPNKTLEIWPE